MPDLVPVASSLRARLFAIVLLGAVMPLAVTGWWLTRTTVRASESDVMDRMSQAVDRVHDEVVSNWYRRRSTLLDLGENALLQDRASEVTLPPWAVRISIRDSSGSTVKDIESPEPPAAGFVLPLMRTLPIREPATGRIVGELEVEMTLSALMDPSVVMSATPGAVLGVYEKASMVSYLPLPFSADVLEQNTFELQGERWRSSRRTDVGVGLTIAAAAPVSAILEPITRTARSGLRVLLLVTVGILILVSLLVRPILRSVQALTLAAEDVARGNLNQIVPMEGSDEISRLGEAFNRMTSTLKETLRRLGEQESLAAVGEFAASLSHDIRNALTSIRVDLQLLGEGIDDNDDLHRIQSRALRRSSRLNETVTAALDLARSGNIRMDEIELRSPIVRAMDGIAAASAEHRCSVDLHLDPENELAIRGDEVALERLFSNLLLNAVQASDPGSSVHISVRPLDDGVEVEISDEGHGIPDDVGANAFRPLVTGRAGGTGIGLAIVDRIARSHGGLVEILETGPAGTRIRVWLPGS